MMASMPDFPLHYMEFPDAATEAPYISNLSVEKRETRLINGSPWFIIFCSQ